MQLSLIQSKIYEITGLKVMVDRDLAAMYEVETRTLNQAVQRNLTRFPSDFMFQLTKTEFDSLISQNVISKTVGRGGIRKMPYAFTEQGVAMLSSVLNSEKAIELNIAIMRTFVLIRQHAFQYKDLQENYRGWKRNTIRTLKKFTPHLICSSKVRRSIMRRQPATHWL